jgi:hypothetical protein
MAEVFGFAKDPVVSVIARGASRILAGAVRSDARYKQDMWLGGLVLVPQGPETIIRRNQEVPDELPTQTQSLWNGNPR